MQSHREFIIPGNASIRDHRPWINKTYFVFWRWFHHTGKLLDMFYSCCWKWTRFWFGLGLRYIIIQTSNQPNCNYTLCLICTYLNVCIYNTEGVYRLCYMPRTMYPSQSMPVHLLYFKVPFLFKSHSIKQCKIP